MQLVKQEYFRVSEIAVIFGRSRSTIYKWLNAYDEDNLNVESMYFEDSARGTIVNKAKLEAYLAKRHKKYL